MPAAGEENKKKPTVNKNRDVLSNLNRINFFPFPPTATTTKNNIPILPPHTHTFVVFTLHRGGSSVSMNGFYEYSGEEEATAEKVQFYMD